MKQNLHYQSNLKQLFFSICFMLLCTTGILNAQTATNGDYRSAKVSGNWSDVDMWETRSGSAWAATATPPSVSNNVYIQEGHTVTVDSNSSCKDLQLNTTGFLDLTSNTVSINGKIRAYTGTTVNGAGADGAFYSGQTNTTSVVSAMVAYTTGGLLKFVGNTRNITNTGEWSAAGLTCDVEFALTAGQIGTLVEGVKFKNITISNGTITTTKSISSGSGISDTFRIASGARYISSSSGSSFVRFSSTAKCGVVQIDNGGTLELTGSTPMVSCTTFTNNGTVQYNGTSQAFLAPAYPSVLTEDSSATTLLHDYSTLIFSNSGSKTPVAPTTVKVAMRFLGSTNIGTLVALTKIITMANGSVIERGGSSSTIISSANSAFVYWGTTASDEVKLLISYTTAQLTNSGEINSSPVNPGPGKINLEINTGANYSFSGTRTINNLLNNGILQMTPSASTITLNINGTMSGTGTIYSKINTAGTPYYGSNLTFNKTGTIGNMNMATNPNNRINSLILAGDLTLGLNGLAVSNNLTLNSGTLNNSSTLTIEPSLNTATTFQNITRKTGALDGTPNFTSTSVNLTYSGGAAINSSYEVPTTATVLNDLTISTGTSLTLNTNTTVNNNIINNGTITIPNTINLVQTKLGADTNSGTGSSVVIRNSNELKRLDYTMWSSPVANQNLLDFSPATLATRFYTYDSSVDKYKVVADPSTTPFAEGTGYLIRMPDDASASTASAYPGVFTGTLNNGDVNIPATGTYIAVGNPYSSTISADKFIDANLSSSEPTLPTTLYYWRKTNNLDQTNNPTTSYATYTKAGGVANDGYTPSSDIAVGQGFITTVPALGNIAFTNLMRTSSTTQFMKTKAPVQKDRVWINLTSGTTTINQMLVAYMDGATTGIDAGIDGKYINDAATALTSNIDGAEYVIQGRPAFNDTDVVSLNFKTEVAGTFTIAKDHTDGLFATGQGIFLVDATTGTETNLQTDAYTFTAPVGTSNSRFKLTYKTSSSLKVNNQTIDVNSISIYKLNGVLNINAGNTTMKNLKVFDIAGRLILEQNGVNSTTTTLKNLSVENQAVLIQITSDENKVVTKKAIN